MFGKGGRKMGMKYSTYVYYIYTYVQNTYFTHTYISYSTIVTKVTRIEYEGRRY